MERIKVAMIVPSLQNRGPVRVVQTIVNESLNQNLPIDFTVIPMSIKNELVMNCAIKPYSKSLDLRNFDVVHTHGLRPDFLAFRKRRSIKKHLVTIHNYVFEDLLYTYNRIVSFFFGRLWMLCWSRANRLICINQDMVSYYKQWTPISIGYIHNGIPNYLDSDLQLVGEKERNIIYELKKQGKTVLGAICVLTRRKGIDQILHLLAKRNDLALIVIGDGIELDNLKALSEELGIQDRCIFFGFRNNAISFFILFDVFIMSSRSEGFGLTLLEAANFSIPCVCSDIPTFRELFSEDEVTFFTLEVIESLEMAVNKILLNRVQFAKAINNKYLVEFTGEILARKYFQEYKQLA
jgi:L-malate glycosyltransferase